MPGGWWMLGWASASCLVILIVHLTGTDLTVLLLGAIMGVLNGLLVEVAQIDSFIAIMRELGLVEVGRTGVAGMTRGAQAA